MPLKTALCLSVLCAVLAAGAVAHDIPRRPDGKPDLNGVWQVLNTANYNLLAHSASAALATVDGPDVLLYEALIEDPKVFTRPWKISMPLYRRMGPDAQIHQFKCVEFVEELMYGHLRKEPIR